MNSNDERLAEIQARTAAATAGPWNYGGQGWVFAEASRGDRRGEMADLLADLHTNDEDALFVAAARTDVPWLLELITQHEATIYQLESVLAEVTNLVEPHILHGPLQPGWNGLRLKIRRALGINDG